MASNQWEKALHLLQEMKDRGIKPDVISYSSAISACERGKAVGENSRFPASKTDCAIKLNVISYNSAIDACFIPVLECSFTCSAGTESGILFIFASRNSPDWDLRECTLSAGCMRIAVLVRIVF